MQEVFRDMNQREFRSFQVKRDGVDVANRRVTLSFASELPYERSFGMEILDVSEKSVRLDRLRDASPLLVNHDPDCQVGVVESVELGADRVGRAVVRFGKSDEASEVFQDVVDGIRQKVSVGYMIHEMILEGKDGDTPIYRVTDWEPFEISIVSIPADITVGVGRSLEPVNKETKMENEDVKATAPAAPAVDVRAVEEKSVAAERARVSEISAIGERFKEFGGAELAREFIANGKSVDAMNAVLLERTAVRKPVPTAEIGLTEKEVRRFSFVRAVNALANPTDRAANEAAAFEFECSRAAADKRGKEARGLLVPQDVLMAPMAERTMITGTGSAGGYTVQTNLLASSFIELLRNQLLVSQLGAQTLNGLTGNVAIPRQTGGATAYWVGEDAAPTTSQQTIDQVTLNPKTVGAFTDYSRKLLIQSSIDVEGMVRNDITKILALEIDRVAIYGTGSATQPLGIKNTTGILSQTFATGSTPTYAELISMETKVAAANAALGNLAYATNATVRGNMKSTPKVTAQPIYLWESDNTVNGYNAYMSNQITSGEVYFGNWSELILAFWSGLDLLVDPYTGSNKGTVRLNALQDVDVALRHPVSFCRGA